MGASSVTGMSKTATHQLVEVKLDDTLAAWVRPQRAQGASWARIALHLEKETGVFVTPESIRSWMADEPGMGRSAKAAS